MKVPYILGILFILVAIPQMGMGSVEVRPGCERGVLETVRFNSTALIHQEFFEHHQLGLRPESAIQLQLKYLTNYWLHLNRERGLRYVPLNLAKISQIRSSSTSYGKQLFVDAWKEDSRPYPKGFHRDRQIENMDPAVRLSYFAEISVLKCNDAPSPPIILPVDPYLAWWSVPASQRKELNYAGHKRRSNPCSTNHAVDVHHPHRYWYVWHPTRRHFTKDGAVVCEELLSTENFLLKPFPLQSSSKPGESETKKSTSPQEIKSIGLVLGYVSSYRRTEIASEIEKFLKEKSDWWKNPTDKVLRKTAPRMEPALLGLFLLLEGVAPVLELQTFRWERREDFFWLHFSGVQRMDKKSFDFRIYFGPTETRMGPATHHEAMAQLLRSSSVFFYLAHSGLGENIPEKVFHPLVEATSPLRVIAILSCKSLLFYAPTISGLKRKNKNPLTLITTTSENYLFSPTGEILNAVLRGNFQSIGAPGLLPGEAFILEHW